MNTYKTNTTPWRRLIKASRSVILVVMLFPLLAKGNHIKGGELTYIYKGPGALDNSSDYEITLKLYLDCQAAGPNQLIPYAYFNFFDRSTLSYARSADSVKMVREEYLNFDPNSNICISNPPKNICYRVRWYTQTFTLPNNAAGYMVVFQNCCRLLGIVNLLEPSDDFGSTFTCEIPGTNFGTNAFKNSSPKFKTNDVAAICINNFFTYSFAAEDPDGDSISYSLCEGFSGGTRGGNNSPVISSPPFPLLGYSPGFSGASPLGNRCSIDPTTGIIKGIAPARAGQYVLTACVAEFRNGIIIATSRKDIHVAVSDCQLVNASLPPDIFACRESTVPLENANFNPPGSLHIWEWGDHSGTDSSTQLNGLSLHTYAQPGLYTIKLKVSLPSGECADSITSLLHFYPGFHTGFTNQGQCLLSPITFTDTSNHLTGTIVFRQWDMGDETRNDDTLSNVAGINWKYSTPGLKTIQLLVKSDKGCIDTVQKKLLITPNPSLQLAFHDTLICKEDTLQIKAEAYGNFYWSPDPNLKNSTIPNPYVHPKSTQYFKVRLEQNACSSFDSVLIRVTDSVSLSLRNDTSICKGDSVWMLLQSNATGFNWTGADLSLIPSSRTTVFFPSNTTTYTLTASIGHCQKMDSITIAILSTPFVEAGKEQLACFGDTVLLEGTVLQASSFKWHPSIFLKSPNSLKTLAFPSSTTLFYLEAIDSAGCPRPIKDSVLIKVNPALIVSAGNDTTTTLNQSVQLQAKGANQYIWSPATFLNNPLSASPIAQPTSDITYILKGMDADGCYAFDTIHLKVLQAPPDLYVPNAFVPGGKNRLLRPVPIGINSLQYFRVFNRWGQLVYQTSRLGDGWDGTLQGSPQEAGTYVWMASATDFTGRVITRKGVAILIR